VRILLVSTYELGHQPVHLASPAAALGKAGVETTLIDLAMEPWDPTLVDEVDAVAISVPMHTAMRLAHSLAEAIRQRSPEVPIAFYGLYAAVGAGSEPDPADARFAGEYEPDLVSWALRSGRGVGDPGLKTYLGSSGFMVPDRSGLPAHDGYARLEWMGETRLAGAVEASHGCRHRCRHCPIPVLYDGRMRVVGRDVVLGDIAQLAGSGVRHVTFADPDFLNAPRYSMDLLRAAHNAHPQLSFDVTVKVEHVLRHEGVWAEAASLGLLFVVSAFESADPATLEILDKGHTVEEMGDAVDLLRSVGIHVRPTWLPFLPWTTPTHLLELAEFLDTHRLWSAIDPVQLAIKLLIPEGSLLEQHPAVLPHLLEYRPSALSWTWEFADGVTGELQSGLDRIAADASDCGAETLPTLSTMRRLIYETAGTAAPPMPDSPPAPRLTESWFCCAEPTAAQTAALGLRIGRVPLATG
jgi:radical SAM superfamily enzyme YgiQ (UPF0313 family)